MTQTIERLRAFDNVAAGETATTTFATGGAVYPYLLLDFKSGGNIGDIDDIELITITAGNDTFTSVSGTMLKSILLAMGIKPDTDGIIIPFTDPRFNSPVSVFGFSLGTGGITNATIEVRIADGVATPSLTAYGAIYGGALSAVPGQVLTIKESIRTIGGAGDAPFEDLPLQGRDHLLHSLFINNAASISEVSFAIRSAGELQIRARLTKPLNDLIRKVGNRTAIEPDADTYMLDFATGESSEMLVLDNQVGNPSAVNSTRLLIAASAAIPTLKVAQVLARNVSNIGNNV